MHNFLLQNSNFLVSSSCFSSHRSRTLLGSTRVCICCSFFVASCSVVTRVTSNVCNDIIDSPFSHPLRISDFDIFPSYDHSLTTLTVFAPFAPTSSLPSRSSALSTLPPPKTRLRPQQRPHTRARSLEMSIDGSSANRYWRLAGV